MKISLVITTLNEAESIEKLLVGIAHQTKKPDEVIIIDAGSIDNTIPIITKLPAYAKSSTGDVSASAGEAKIKIIEKKNISRARGRNLGVRLARNEIIAMTDAGCVPHKDWLQELTKPFNTKQRDPSTTLRMTNVVAGFYKMTGKSNLQKAMIPFMGVTPDKFNDNFLPSTRSIAFTKSIWKRVGGFNTKLDGAGEDTMFNYDLTRHGAKIVRAKKAIVEWGMPTSIFNFQFKIFNYSKGDAKTKIYFHPAKGLWSHNIHTLSIFARYFLFAFAIFVYPTSHKASWGTVILLIYLLWSIYKTRKTVVGWQSRLFVTILQVTSDMAVMLGFIWGTLSK